MRHRRVLRPHLLPQQRQRRLLIPLESQERLVERIGTGDELEVRLDESIVHNLTKNERYALRPLGDVLPIIEAGGIFPYAKKAGMLK